MSTWHCGETTSHGEHRWRGDGYYGLFGYLCTGQPGDVAVLIPELGARFKKREVDALTARIEEHVRQQDRADALEMHQIMLAAIVRGGYRGSETMQVARLLTRLTGGGSDAN